MNYKQLRVNNILEIIETGKLKSITAEDILNQHNSGSDWIFTGVKITADVLEKIGFKNISDEITPCYYLKTESYEYDFRLDWYGGDDEWNITIINLKEEEFKLNRTFCRLHRFQNLYFELNSIEIDVSGLD